MVINMLMDLPVFETGLYVLVFYIYTECYINSNGYNPKSQQHAVFSSLVYRLLRLKKVEQVLAREVNLLMRGPSSIENDAHDIKKFLLKTQVS